MRKLSLRHVTRYLYPQPARFLPHRLLLRPREGHDVRVVSSRLLIEPACTVEASFEAPRDIGFGERR